MISDLQDQIYRFRQVLLKTEENARISNEDHKLMLKLISKHDLDGVEGLVREHILRGQRIVMKQFDKGHIA
jgi:DNA-binding GntR family transcriptional regulator